MRFSYTPILGFGFVTNRLVPGPGMRVPPSLAATKVIPRGRMSFRITPQAVSLVLELVKVRV